MDDIYKSALTYFEDAGLRINPNDVALPDDLCAREGPINLIYIPKGCQIELPLDLNIFRVSSLRDYENFCFFADEKSQLTIVYGCQHRVRNSDPILGTYIAPFVAQGARLTFNLSRQWNGDKEVTEEIRSVIHGSLVLNEVDFPLKQKKKRYSANLVSENAEFRLSRVLVDSLDTVSTSSVHIQPPCQGKARILDIVVHPASTVNHKVLMNSADTKVHYRCSSMLGNLMEACKEQLSETGESIGEGLHFDAIGLLKSRGWTQEKIANAMLAGDAEKILGEFPMEISVEFLKFVEDNLGNLR